ncbi:dynactin subunit 2-A-like [Pollicipes pollicipes]|uniref:dynactin subunit 2-A-like n=1 Tax=Pollicipes pollicipes TaxID=41117 RepID=UPI00188521CF|nr:dynactin subunit 2-A-like [Pollicipes pollicipes]XP_037089338.1 dynactin subunit 2-A-like [Pollicipes pollicipes]XP_037089339.1 dynactin subunit 2-A-like [Pollicipes pollicipes]
MADPKYANLPGLAPDDEPDTFETDERPEADQDADYDDESENVEKLHVSATEAFNKFKDKSLDGQKADFSDRLRRGLNTGYAARTGQWELAGEGEPETVVQKYQRLKLEVQQLDEEIASVQSGLQPDSSEEDRSSAQIGAEVERLHRHLAEVNLEQLLGAQVLNALGDPQGALRSKLELQLSQLASGAAPAAKSAAPASGEGATYELHVRPEKARAQQASALGELEKRLERMERAVGATPEKMSRLSAETRQRSLLSAVATLSSKVALLDPATLEAAEARLQALHQRMNQLAEQRAAGVDADKLSTITELHDLMQKTAGVQGELPAILERLNSLQTLHDHALNFSRSLTQLESAQQKIEAGLSQGEARLGQVQADCAASLDTIKQGLDSLAARLAAVKK